MKNKPLLSIVVPTRNRYKYLKYLIELVSQFKSEEIELVIQDNSDCNDEIKEFFNEHIYKQLKYYYYDGSLSVKENSDQAILHSSGEYVCLLGDDDGLLSTVIRVVNYMKDNSIDYLISLPTFYNWPDFYDPSIFNLTSSISYIKGSGKFIKLNPIHELKRTISNGFDGLYRMPKVYQAVVSRHILNKVFLKCNTFFPGPSPDMANAVALSVLDGKLYLYDAPLFISGQCRNFGGGERVQGANNLKRITEVPFLPKTIEETWNEKLPIYWCADTIWPQSGIESMTAMGVNYKVAYDQILAHFIFNHPNYRNECIGLIDNRWAYNKYYVKYIFKKAYAFCSHRLSYFLSGKRRLNEYTIVRNINTIIEAVKYIENVG